MGYILAPNIYLIFLITYYILFYLTRIIILQLNDSEWGSGDKIFHWQGRQDNKTQVKK